MAYGFAKTEFEPYAAEWDKTKHFPMDQYRKAADLGFGGIYVSEKYGGCGLGRLEASLIFEALSTGKHQESIYTFFRLRWLVCISKHSQHVCLDDRYSGLRFFKGKVPSQTN